MQEQQTTTGNFSVWGEGYRLYHLTNTQGTQVDISNLGATIIHFRVCDNGGKWRDIVLNYPLPTHYLAGEFFLGAVVGPWANRIAGGRYTLNGHRVQLDQNEGQNHLHGGGCQLHKKTWQVVSHGPAHVTLATQVKQQEAGYPATIDIQVTYQLTHENALVIRYFACPNHPCPINLTQHSYFNLTGGEMKIYDHELTLMATQFWQIDHQSIPTQCQPVEETSMDFLRPKKLGNCLAPRLDEMLEPTAGFDHCFMLEGTALRSVAQMSEPLSGLHLAVLTTEPAMQLYTGNFLTIPPHQPGFEPYSGVCLETQAIPNQINMPALKDQVVYSATHPYQSCTVYQVSCTSFTESK